jgi:hypothetical protein
MGKLTPQRFTVESFQDQASWIGPLLSSLNSLINDLVINFNNGLTIADNLNQEIKEISWKNDANNLPLRFTTKFNKLPQGLSVIYLFNTTDGVYSTQAPWLEWTYQNNQIVISDITGLTASKNYTMRLLVIYG